MDDHRLHAGWASTTLVLSPIGIAMVSRAGVWFITGPVHPYWIEKARLSKCAEPRCAVNPSVVRPFIH